MARFRAEWKPKGKPQETFETDDRSTLDQFICEELLANTFLFDLDYLFVYCADEP